MGNGIFVPCKKILNVISGHKWVLKNKFTKKTAPSLRELGRNGVYSLEKCI